MVQLKITQVRSASRRKANQGRTLTALGIRRNQQSVVKEDSPQIRGMIATVVHLVKVEEVK
jgi:large subunit ribosomal protein L30